ncbi:MAG: beta-glucosidase [Ruminococcaceae bacterium]|nr:beta-glucosidase [Oscillospiraceae bacterium]
MNRLLSKLGRTIQDTGKRILGNELAQEENVVFGEKIVTPGMPEILRKIAGEGIVLLENDGVLPLKAGQRVSVFGRCQNDWFYVGYGSGGDVHPPYTVSLMEGLRSAGVPVNEDLAGKYAAWCEANPADHGFWGHWPYFHPEMPLEDAAVDAAAAASDVAILVIGRAAGEDRENVLEAGSYYLTEQEHTLLRQVTKAFAKVVVLLNSGNIMDLSFTKMYPISALVYAWQLGMESGNAVADVLTGKVNPSGKLSATIARNYPEYPSSAAFGNKEYNNYEEDIYVGYRYFSTFAPDKVLYPFGYGLSYTTFSLTVENLCREDGLTTISVRVANTGDTAGREVVQVYCAPPAGKLSKAARNLVAYGKTGLLQPGEEAVLTLTIRDLDCASFDDSGVTGFKDAFLLEQGEYKLYVGNCSTADTLGGSFAVEETTLLQQCSECCGPEKPFDVLTEQGMKPVTLSSRNLKQRILDNLPEAVAYTGDQGIKLLDVKEGRATLDAFIAQLSDAELGDLSRGEGPMNSHHGTVGNAGAFGGITEALRAKGIPPVITADGPSGLRVKLHTSLLPCGTAIACTWDNTLAEMMYAHMGREVHDFEVDVLLSPGMNIHRNPLCGRNFEYYSEDPYLTGKMAAAAVRGIQSAGVSACPKHFACNNQEVNRNKNDSRVSMRALREIYLKGFEICVREAAPRNIMTSYNKINGVWSHYNYDLATTILRQEWGYQGNIVTDWWMQKSVSPEFPTVRNSAYRVRAQVDVLMPGGDSYAQQKYVFDQEQLETLDKPEGLTRGELQRTARNVLNFILKQMEYRNLFQEETE